MTASIRLRASKQRPAMVQQLLEQPVVRYLHQPELAVKHIVAALIAN
jgi:hypothetical protein